MVFKNTVHIFSNTNDMNFFYMCSKLVSKDRQTRWTLLTCLMESLKRLIRFQEGDKIHVCAGQN